ncbi:MAG TPA: Holliday junction resolvase RuvX [Thermoanaerobaculaceae bacterium]|nr:Holliday junction resolvase RuvX [Thermoanaerobaculaceae bacterium]
MRWLALDIGSRRIGVAVCDSEERVATALDPFAFTGSEGVAERVAALVRAREAEGIVVGVPRTRAGGGPGERRVSAVVDVLRARLTAPVELIDERGTTAVAEALLLEAGVPRRRWRGLVDSLAARLILESFLALRARSGAASR